MLQHELADPEANACWAKPCQKAVVLPAVVPPTLHVTQHLDQTSMRSFPRSWKQCHIDSERFTFLHQMQKAPNMCQILEGLEPDLIPEPVEGVTGSGSSLVDFWALKVLHLRVLMHMLHVTAEQKCFSLVGLGD